MNQPRDNAGFDASAAFDALGFGRLFTCFRIAMQPWRLILALLLIVGAYTGGRLLDSLWGKQVYQQEFQVYAGEDTHGLNPALVEAIHRSTGVGPIDADALAAVEPTQGTFDAALDITLETFENGVRAVARFEVGFDQLAPSTRRNPDTIIGAIRTLFIAIPIWLCEGHPGFTSVYAIVLLLLWSLLGGAISRQAMMDATVGQTITASEGVAYVWRRWMNYIVTPALPLLIIGVFALLLAIAGVLLRVPGLNVIVAFFLFLALGIAFVMALLLIGWFGGMHLLYPALSAEGTDSLDALARAFSYVLAKPWRLVYYGFVSLIYGTITYLFVGLFIFIMITVTHASLGVWAGEGFNEMFPQPKFGEMRYEIDEDVKGVDKATAVLIYVWRYLLISTWGAYAISFYFAACSQVYLLLRRYTDGTDFTEVFVEHGGEPVVSDKVEPAAEASAEGDQPDSDAE